MQSLRNCAPAPWVTQHRRYAIVSSATSTSTSMPAAAASRAEFAL
jgi:hypothetical protein